MIHFWNNFVESNNIFWENCDNSKSGLKHKIQLSNQVKLVYIPDTHSMTWIISEAVWKKKFVVVFVVAILFRNHMLPQLFSTYNLNYQSTWFVDLSWEANVLTNFGKICCLSIEKIKWSLRSLNWNVSLKHLSTVVLFHASCFNELTF